MNGVIGMTELLLDTELSAEQREFTTTIESSASALLDLINDILDYSKIEAGRLDLESIPFRLREHLHDTFRPLAVRAHQKGLELALDIHSDVPDIVVGDPGRLRQIVINLIGNAIKFTERGEVVFHAGIQEQGGGEATLICSVKDTGIGIPPEKQRVIFEAFTQADGSTSRRFGGTGLGLTISSQLVKAMGGRIWVESEAGQGSSFYFSVRLRLGEQTSGRLVASAPVELRDVRVLIVDDSATNRRILAEIMRGWKVDAAQAEDGHAAVAAITAARNDGHPFTLAVLDFQMPQMDGLTLARRIRQELHEVELEIIILTSSAARGDAAICRELRIGAYLPKPVRAGDLLEAIRTVLGLSVGRVRPAVVTRHTRSEERRDLQILLVEDNPVNVIVASRMLQKRSHTVVTAKDGQQAIELFKGQMFDIVFMDVQMPVMDGYEATARIRSLQQASDHRVPIVALTAHASQQERGNCLAAGMDEFLTKPIVQEKLLDVLQRYFPGSDSKVEATSTVPGKPGLIHGEFLLKLVDGDSTILVELLRVFRQDAESMRAIIGDALVRDDNVAIKDAAHRLRGALSTLGAIEVSAAAAALEAAADSKRTGLIETSWRLLDELLSQLDRSTGTLATALAHDDKSTADLSRPGIS